MIAFEERDFERREAALRDSPNMTVPDRRVPALKVSRSYTFINESYFRSLLGFRTCGGDHLDPWRRHHASVLRS